MTSPAKRSYLLGVLRRLATWSVSIGPMTSGDSVARTEPNVLWTICVILLIMWLLGLVSGYTIGGLIHVLLVIAIVVVLVRLIQGRSPL